MTIQKVAVIGAGVSGLAAAKELRAAGLEPTVFERSSRLGGLWYFDEAVPGGGGPAYRSLHTNISRHAMGFSDHPMPDPFPDFPSHRQVLGYLESYSSRFGIDRDLHLEHEVVSANRHGRRWNLMVKAAGRERSELFDALVVASGRHQTPRWPEIAGRDEFRGQVLHSTSYSDPEPFAGRSVLIIGTGSSGVDIAEELAPVARRTLLSTSRGAWFVPRTVGRRPADHNVTRLGNLLPRRLREAIFRFLIEREYSSRGIELARCRMPVPRFDLLRARITPVKELVRLIVEGTVEIAPEVRKLERDGVEFADGGHEAIDAVIAATGYRFELPFFEPGEIPWEGRTPRLYKHVFAPGLDRLAFVGVPWVIGAYPPVLELQARWMARVFAGHCSLPPAEVMKARVERAVRHAHRDRVDFDRVQPIDYMADLALEIGCRPRPWRHPRLLRVLLTGPFLPAHYRLDGPGRTLEAGATIAQAGGRRPASTSKRSHPSASPQPPPELDRRRCTGTLNTQRSQEEPICPQEDHP